MSRSVQSIMYYKEETSCMLNTGGEGDEQPATH